MKHATLSTLILSLMLLSACGGSPSTPLSSSSSFVESNGSSKSQPSSSSEKESESKQITNQGLDSSEESSSRQSTASSEEDSSSILPIEESSTAYTSYESSLEETSSPVDSSLYHTVSFDTDGGTTIEPQIILHGEYATRPTQDPEKEGYFFMDWLEEDRDTPFDFEATPIESDRTIYALYEEDVDDTPYLYFYDEIWWGSASATTYVSFDEGDPQPMNRIHNVGTVETKGTNIYSVPLLEGASKVRFYRYGPNDNGDLVYYGATTKLFNLDGYDQTTKNAFRLINNRPQWTSNGDYATIIEANYDPEEYPIDDGIDYSAHFPKKLYFENTQQWEFVYVYAIGKLSDGVTRFYNSWPGFLYSGEGTVIDAHGKPLIEIDNMQDFSYAIFSNGEMEGDFIYTIPLTPSQLNGGNLLAPKEPDEDGLCEITISVYEKDPNVSFTYVVYNLPENAFLEGREIGAWAWEDDMEGYWVKTSRNLERTNAVEFTVSTQLNGFLIAVSNGGGFDWNAGEGENGQILAKSNDIYCNKGEFVYSPIFTDAL